MNENLLAASNNKDFVAKLHSWERTNFGSTSKDGSNNYVDKEDIPNYIEYAYKFAEAILEDEEEMEKRI